MNLFQRTLKCTLYHGKNKEVKILGIILECLLIMWNNVPKLEVV